MVTVAVRLWMTVGSAEVVVLYEAGSTLTVPACADATLGVLPSSYLHVTRRGLSVSSSTSGVSNSKSMLVPDPTTT